jgi:tetratricopeptide (TPR) repeat protein
LAVACFKAGQYDRAVDLLRPFTGVQGKAEAFNLLGAIEEKRGRSPEAEHAFEEAAAGEPSNEDYRFDYGNSLVQHGKLALALTAFRAGVNDLPSSWKLKIGLGSAYYLSGNYEDAARALLETVTLNRDSTAGWNLLGEAYETAVGLQRQIEAAFASYLKTAPLDARAYYHYGAILFEHAQADGHNDYRQAIRNIDQALRLNPDLAEAYFELGLIALAEGRAKEGIGALEKALSLEPGLAAAHYRLAMAYKRAGDERRAQEELRRFRVLKEEERQRGRVLQSLASITSSAPGSGGRP